MHVAAKTDRGKRRRENEDGVLVREYGTPDTSSSPAYLLAIADGMGGAAGGQTASSSALQALEQSMSRSSADPGTVLGQAIAAANAHVRSVALNNPELLGMATTLVVAYVANGRAWLANVGDSRAYLVRDGHAQRLTQDHSWVGEQVRAGVMTDEEASQHPRRNIITRSVGSEAGVQPDVFEPISLEAGDCLVLCSDGLHGLVSDAEIAAICGTRSPEQAVDELVALANARGGPDNISVVVGQAGQGSDNTMVLRLTRSQRGAHRMRIAAAVVGAALIALVVVAFSLPGNDNTDGSLADAGVPATEGPGVLASLPPTPDPSPTPQLQLDACPPGVLAKAQGIPCLTGVFATRPTWDDQADVVKAAGIRRGLPADGFAEDLVLKAIWFYTASTDFEGACEVRAGEKFALPIRNGAWPNRVPEGWTADLDVKYGDWLGCRGTPTPSPSTTTSPVAIPTVQ